MAESIFLLQDDKLAEVTAAPYDSEDVLQTLLAEYPNLLAGAQMNPAAPRRWVLVRREAEVPDVEDGTGRWRLDHLFLDQEAIPTLVEVKRSSDTRIRREVVGQMLDYAANALRYWPFERLRAQFEETQDDPAGALRDLLGEKTDVEAFWGLVKTNLQAGRVRMVFVADEIPPELERIVEFLNEQMDPAEVLAVEIRQFVNKEGTKILVPRVLGHTAEAQTRKGKVQAERQWDEESHMNELGQRSGPEAVSIARELLRWAKNTTVRGDYVWWGRGALTGSFIPVLQQSESRYQLFAVYTSGSVEVCFQHFANKPPFDAVEKREELRTRLNEIEEVAITPDRIDGKPQFPIKVLCNPERLKKFIECMDWVVAEIRKV